MRPHTQKTQSSVSFRWLFVYLVVCLVNVSDALAQITFSEEPGDTSALCQYIPPQQTILATSICPGAVTVMPMETRTDGSCTHEYTLIRTWEATDACGTVATISQVISVTDPQSPILIGVPGNVTVRPGNEPPAPNVRALDFCDDDVVLSTSRDSFPGPCGGYTLTYIFSAEDDCGNIRTAQYVVSVTDEEIPTISGVTPGRRLSCGEALPAAPTVTATDNGGTPTLTMVLDTLLELGGDTCMLIRRTWTAEDDCGLSTTAQQAFSLHDDQAPIITGAPGDTIIYCEALPLPPAIGVDIMATDDCSAVPTIVYTEVSGQTADGTCTDVNYEVVRTWTATDDCGNVTTATQVLHLKCECCFNGIDDDDDGLVDDYDPHCNCFSGVASECDSTKRYYIPPVWHPSERNYNQPSELVITTLSDVANVHIMTGDGTTMNQNFVVRKGTPLIIPLTTDQLQTPNHDRVENDRGWILTSDQLIQPLYRIDAFYNKVLVTVKGPQAVGRVFRAGSQTNTCGQNRMGNGEGHFISVMATEDNTDVTFNINFPTLTNQPSVFTKRLNKFDTYLIRDNIENTTVSGSLVTSTKPIVVTSGSQHTVACEYENGRLTGRIARGMDGGIDQLVPNCLTGDEYVLVRGTGSDQQQYATLVANKNNTRVFIDGDTNSELVLNAGEHTQIWLDGGAYQPKHFKGNKPFYMFHTSGISDNNEVGMAIAAPIGECKGDTLVDFPKFSAANTTSPVSNAVYVIVPTDGLSSLKINGRPYTDCATATQVASLPSHSVVTFLNSCLNDINSIRCDRTFTAGMLVGISGQTGTHGYLTAFKDRMTIYKPGTDQQTTGYLVDTLCGEQIDNHCIDVSSCAVNHSIAAVRGGQGTVRLTGGTCFEYTSPDDYHGLDELLVTLQNDQGLFQTVCLSYFICAEPPEAQFPFIDTLVNCDMIPPLDTPILSDECDMTVEFDTEEVTYPGGCEYAYVVERHWTIWDDCGDSTRATQTIRVHDTLAPQVIDLPNDTVIASCAGLPPVPTLNFQENCDNSFEWRFREETIDSICIYDRTIVRTWEAWDNCGNNSTAVQRIELRDTTAPVFNNPPSDEVVSCTGAWSVPAITISDDCDPLPTLTLDSTVFNSICDTLYHVVRVWTATDACGRSATTSQRLLVLDLESPVVLNIPADTSILCGQPLPTTAPTFTDDCTVPVPVYVVDSTAAGSCPVVNTIYRRWVATDDCGNVTSAEQIIEVIDTLGPEFVPLPDTIFSSCLDSVVVLEPSVIEACNLTLTFTDSMAAGTNCTADRFLYRTYLAVDNCGRQAAYTQLYYFQDIVPPFWVNEPADTILTCDQAIPAPINPTVADACSGLNPIAMVERDSQRICPARRWLFRTYTVSDWCGNLTTFTNTIIIDGCEPAVPALATAQSDCIGENIILQASVDSGYTTPVYLWQFSADGVTWSDLAQPSDSTSLTLPDAQPSDAGQYRVVVANNVAGLSIQDCSSTSPPVALSLNPVASSDETIDLCRGDTLFYLGDTLTASLSRIDTLATYLGCDSVATLNLNVYPFVQWSLDTTLCFGESLEVFGRTYTSSGTYADTLLTAYGCDTTLALTLKILPDLRDTSNVFLCPGSSITFEGTTYSTAGVYSAALTSVNGCDSTRTLILTDGDVAVTALTERVCPGESITVGSQVYTSTGTYSDTLLTATGCDSIVNLDLVVADTSTIVRDVVLCTGDTYFFGDTLLRTAGSFRQNLTSSLGCDSSVVVNVSMAPVYDQEIRTELCAGEVYTNQNYQFSSAGRWRMEFYTADGCDSIVHVTLVYRPTFDIVVDTMLCEGEAYQLHDTLITTAGTFTRVGQSQFSCDSVVTVTTRIQPLQSTRLDTAICFGESLTVAGNSFTQSTTDTIRLLNQQGCDSLIYLSLLVRPNPNADTTALICEGDAFYTDGRSYTQTGVYRYTDLDRFGCDSTYTVFLTVIPTTRDTLDAQICSNETYIFGTRVLSMPGLYEEVHTSRMGCDSIEYLRLQVADTYATATRDTICYGSSYLIGDSTYRSAGTYVYTFASQAGCDSVVTLTLYMRDQITSFTDSTICANTSIQFGTRTLTTSGLYRDTLTASSDCDSISVLELTVRELVTSDAQQVLCQGDTLRYGSYEITQAGVYIDTLTAITGCDSLARLTVDMVTDYRMRYEQTICEGETYLFAGNEITEAGTYTARFDSRSGCDSTVTIDVFVIEDITLDVEDIRMCRGETGILSVLNYDGEVQWSPTEGLVCPTCLDTEVRVDETTVFTATAIDCYGEEIIATATVTIDRPVDVSIVSAEKIRLGERTTLVGVANNPAARMAWREGTELLCEGCSEVEVMPLETTTYIVEARTAEGCDDTEQLTLIVEDECSFGEVLVPNVMTPNADGYNDMLEIRYEGIQEIVLLKIFDRWGELVYETRNIDVYWDGTHHGEPVNPGVFVYYLEGYCLNGEEFTHQGNVTVVR